MLTRDTDHNVEQKPSKQSKQEQPKPQLKTGHHSATKKTRQHSAKLGKNERKLSKLREKQTTRCCDSNDS